MCQQSGHCCCDQNIIVTLTYSDIYRLYLALNKNFNRLIQKIIFYSLSTNSDKILQNQMVLNPIHSSDGLVIPGLRKFEGGRCIFYKQPNCMVYSKRPLACQNYPFAFVKHQNKIAFTWVKNSINTCIGIEKGFPISDDEIKRLGRKFFEEIYNHNKLVENLNLEASKDNPLSAREALWMMTFYAEKIEDRLV